MIIVSLVLAALATAWFLAYHGANGLAWSLALAGARDLATLVVALETATLPVVGMVALRRDAQGAQSALTFLLTTIASLGMLVLGCALLLISTGSLHLDRIATVLAADGLPSSVTAVAVLAAALMLLGGC